MVFLMLFLWKFKIFIFVWVFHALIYEHKAFNAGNQYLAQLTLSITDTLSDAPFHWPLLFVFTSSKLFAKGRGGVEFSNLTRSLFSNFLLFWHLHLFALTYYIFTYVHIYSSQSSELTISEIAHIYITANVFIRVYNLSGA